MRAPSRQQLARSITRSVDAPAALAPVLGELFAGIDALGSMPSLCVRELFRAGITRRSRVLDLACGKGAVGVEAARRLGCRVVGIDACEPFVASAQALAERRGVRHLCRFSVGDVHADPRSAFDAAVMIGLLPLVKAARLLRERTRPGGVYLIDDCWWDDRIAEPPNRACFTKLESTALIEHLGDRVERLVTPTPSVIHTLNKRIYRRLRANAKSIECTAPRLRKPLRQFLANQRAAHRLLGDVLRPALWVVRRA